MKLPTHAFTIFILLSFSSCTESIHLSNSNEIELSRHKEKHYILTDENSKIHIHTFASHNQWANGKGEIALLSPYVTYVSNESDLKDVEKRDELLNFLLEYLQKNYSFSTYLMIPGLLGDFNEGFELTQPLVYEYLTSPSGPAAKSGLPIVESFSELELHPSLFPENNDSPYSMGLRMHAWEGRDMVHISLYILDNRKEELIYVHDLQYASSPVRRDNLLLAIDFMLSRVSHIH